MTQSSKGAGHPTHRTAEPVAIIGIGCLFPKAGDLQAYWANVKHGVDAITDVPKGTHWRHDDYFSPDPKAQDRTVSSRGGFLSPVDFDPLGFGIQPNILEATDTAQLLGMYSAVRALEDAGYGKEREFDRSRVSVILGVTSALELIVTMGARLGHPKWRAALRDAGVSDDVADDVMQRISESYVPWQENTFPGLLGNVVAGRISNHLDLGGTNCVVDAACASSLSALHMALMEIETGRSNMVVTGGVDTFSDIFMYTCFSKTFALSPTGDARPFDTGGDGTILGEGMGILVLKRLSEAKKDNDNIHAVIRGIGSSGDGKGNAIYAPSAEGQERALRTAYARADVTPDTLELIEAHGTGTTVGDDVELTALTKVFSEAKVFSDGNTVKKRWCAVGSVKSQIGHTKAGAGVAGLIKATMALKHKVLPPSIKVEQPLEKLRDENSPFYLMKTARPWLSRAGHPRRAGISSFGFGGSNYHCVLEEYGAAKQAPDWSGDVELLTFSADSARAIEKTLDDVRPDLSWEELMKAAARSRIAFDAKTPCRLAFVVSRDADRNALWERIRTMLKNKADEGAWSLPDGVWFDTGSNSGKMAFVFPGQGSQYVDMARDTACTFPQFLDALASMNDASLPGKDKNKERISDFIYPHSSFDEETTKLQEESLRATRIAQPAIGAVSLGAFDWLASFGIRPEATAGHSYGEFVALHAAGVINRKTLCELSKLRGELMTMDSGDRGSMLAVRAPLDKADEVIRENRIDLVIANRNAPEQAVLSGRTDEVKRAKQVFSDLDIRCSILPVSAAFHSELVADAAEPFQEAMKKVKFAKASIPVYANTTGEEYPTGPAKIRNLLANQLARPVEFVKQIENMYASGIRTFVEVGPGARLSGLVKAILAGKEFKVLSFDSSSGKRSGMIDAARLLAEMAACGYIVDLANWNAGCVDPDAETKKPKLVVPITGANYSSPREKRPPTERPVSGTSATGKPAAAPQAAPATPIAPAVQGIPASQGTPASQVNQAPQVAPATPTAPAPQATPAQPPSPAAASPALQRIQDSMMALQKMQEQTAELHRQFLESQQNAARMISDLMMQQPGVAPAMGAHMPPMQQSPQPASQEYSQTQAFDQQSLAQEQSISQQQSTSQEQSISQEQSTSQAQAGAIPQAQPVVDPALPREAQETTMQPQTSAEPEATAPAMAGAQMEAGTQAETSSVDTTRIETVLLETVADKTGYPVDMLELDMSLDSDLGIDSIKRVEILSTLKEQLPDAPLIESKHLGELQTLRHIVNHLAGGMEAAAEAPATAAVESAASQAAPAAVAEGGILLPEIESALLETIADKTGYPVDMLELEMTLDSDLGIDSIKRVEILSALRERFPEAPPIESKHMGELQTLRHIVEHLGRAAPASETPVAEAAANSDPAEASTTTEKSTADETPDPEARLERMVLGCEPLDAASPRDALTVSDAYPIWITAEDTGLADKIAEALNARGNAHTRIVSLEEIDRLDAPDALSGLIILTPRSGVDDAFLLQAFKQAQKAEAALRKAGATGGAFLATVSRLDGRFGLSGNGQGNPFMGNPLSGGLAGLAKTAGHEWPEVRCRALDLADDYEDQNAAAKAIVEELFFAGPAEVGLSKDSRWKLHLSNEPLSADSPSIEAAPIKQDDVLLITGGARGVTADTAIAMARAFKPRLVLLGRSPTTFEEPAWLAGLTTDSEIKQAIVKQSAEKLAPKQVEDAFRKYMANREMRDNINRMESTGATVRYVSVDLRDAEAIANTVAEIRNDLGPVKGIIHGAGVLADRKISDKTEEQFDRVFGTKVTGLRNLLSAVASDDLKVLVLFSSTTGRFGRTGQVDYSMANEVLNKMAQQVTRDHAGCRVVSVNWGPWDGGMVTPALKTVFESEGVALIDRQAGADYLTHEICLSPEGPVEVLLMGGPLPAEYDIEVAEPGVSENVPGNGSGTDMASDTTLSPAFDLNLDVDRFHFLQGHVMNNKAVLPVAVTLEWLGHAALHAHPGYRFFGMNDLRVFKGAILDRDDAMALRFFAGSPMQQDGLSIVPVEMRGALAGKNPMLLARADVVLASQLPKGESAIHADGLEPRTSQDPYREILFHKPPFQSLDAIRRNGDDVITALARVAPKPAKWMARTIRGAWLANPLAVDAAFQLMIVWSFDRYGTGSLPSRVGEYRQFKKTYPKDKVRILARVTDHSASRALTQLEFRDPDSDALIARITDYESIIDATLNRAFKRNKLNEASTNIVETPSE